MPSGSFRLFGRKEPSDDAQALAELAESKELLDKREQHLQRRAQQELAAAMEHKKAERKSAALGCLKRKQMVELELDGLQEQRLKLDTQEHMLQSLRFSEVTTAAERRATEAIRSKLRQMEGADGIERRREQTEDALEEAYELISIAAQPVANPALGSIGDDALWAELVDLEEAEARRDLDAELLELGGPAFAALAVNTASPAALPHMPVGDVMRQRQKEEKEAELAELAGLEASMAMPMAGLAVPRAMAVHVAA